MLELDWSFRIADIIAIGLGSIGIIISIGIFIKQNNASKNIEKLRESTISLSIARIYASLETIVESIVSTIEIVKVSVGDAENKIASAKVMMSNEQKFYSQVIENTSKEVDFLKGQMNPYALAQIELSVDRIKKFSTSDSLEINFGSNADTLKTWYMLGQEAIQKTEEVMKEMREKPIRFGHKKRFRAKNYQ